MDKSTNEHETFITTYKTVYQEVEENFNKIKREVGG